MSRLVKLRNRLNLTQEQLAEKAGVSVRTIQRIESGGKLKGFTLEAIAKALDVSIEDLQNKEKVDVVKDDKQLVKLINLSSLPFVIVPIASILVPLIIMFLKKKYNPMIKEIISIQILWTVLAIILVVLSAFVKKWLSLNGDILLTTLTVLIVINVFIIIRNTVEIDRKNKLHVKLNFSFF